MLKHFSLIEIKKELFQIKSLDSSERKLIYNKLREYKSGGITYGEFRKVILELRKEYKISETDERYLKRLLLELKS